MIHAILSLWLLAGGSLIFLLGPATKAAPVSPLVPEVVQTVTRQQIKAYFGTNSVIGIPLVDPRVDWLDFTRWPDEFQFRGETYQIRVEEYHGDYTKPLPSRSEIKKGMSFYVTYRLKGSDSRGTLIPGAIWRTDGSMGHKELNWRDGKTDGYVFVHQFGPTGRLSIFAYINDQSRYCIQYYSPSGELVGDYSVPNRGPGPRIYRWNGKAVTSDDFTKLSRDYLNTRWGRGPKS